MTTDLVNQLRKASEAYYAGHEIISDSEFDLLLEELETTDPDNSFLKEIGTAPDAGVWPKVEHVMHMGSQKKITTFDELEKWWSKYTSGDLFFSEKMDGSSIELIYQNGALVRAVTRGNGKVGDDITPNVKKMIVPLTIPMQIDIAIRCEIVLLNSTWGKHFPDTKNPRNVAAGIARRKTNSDECRFLRCYALDVVFPKNINYDFKTKIEVYQFLKSCNFHTPAFGLLNEKHEGVLEAQQLKEIYEAKTRASLDYEIDGLVIEDNDLAEQKKQGIIDDRPRGSRAYKFSSATTETVLEKVEWQVGRTQICPVAILTPVKLGGVTITRTTLCNLDEIKSLGVGIGSKVRISRRNDVIPKLEVCLTPGEPINPPTECPSCGAPTDTDGIRLFCTGDDCGNRTLKTITHYLTALSVKGLGDKQVERFVDNKLVKTPADLYALTPSDFESEKVGTKVLTDLRNKSKEVPIEMFVKSLAIHKFGRGKTEEILKVIPTLEGIRNASVAELNAIHLVGPEVAKAAVVGLEQRKELIDLLLQHVTLKKVGAKVVGGAMEGMAFCFTGVRNKAAEATIKERGGSVVGSVSKNTTHLIAADLSSVSSKMKKAKSLGLTIMDEAGLKKLLF